MKVKCDRINPVVGNARALKARSAVGRVSLANTGMPSSRALESRLEPLLALAPMQDLTDLPFWNLLDQYGAADFCYTPYFRVHATSRLDIDLLESIRLSPSSRPIVGQLIGENLGALVRSARELQQHRVVAVDLNLGCPAPIVCRKKVGGGLLQHLDRVDGILGALRASLDLPFTVKTRLGYADRDHFDGLLELFNRHQVDLVAIHARTVKALYGGTVDYESIAWAVKRLRCPVLANGDIVSASQALQILGQTKAHGVMIGRGAIRNPWIFAQIRCARAGEPVRLPTGFEVLNYICRLYTATKPTQSTPLQHVKRIKKFMNFVGLGIEPSGQFLRQIRRAATEADFFKACERWLSHSNPMPLEPFAGVS